MPHIASLMPRVLATSLALVSFSIAWAQPAPTVRIRGTIEAVDGPVLAIKSREGTDMKVRMTDNVAVFGVAKTALSEIKEVALVMVLPGRWSQGRKPSAAPRWVSGKICTATAFCVPSGSGIAVTPM